MVFTVKSATTCGSATTFASAERVKPAWIAHGSAATIDSAERVKPARMTHAIAERVKPAPIEHCRGRHYNIDHIVAVAATASTLALHPPHLISSSRIEVTAGSHVSPWPPPLVVLPVVLMTMPDKIVTLCLQKKVIMIVTSWLLPPPPFVCKRG